MLREVIKLIKEGMQVGPVNRLAWLISMGPPAPFGLRPGVTRGATPATGADFERLCISTL
jgi:hypothetical protein